MDRQRFINLVEQAMDGLPDEFLVRLENVDITVEDFATPEQLQGDDKLDLLGLYEGVPLPERDRGYNLVMPDRITIFQKPIEAVCENNAEIIREIEETVRHEIAHFFGISDERLDEMSNRRNSET